MTDDKPIAVCDEEILKVQQKIQTHIIETNEKFILETILPYCSQVEQREVSKEELISALEKAEKYKWHDLRKNPEDLPENGYVFVCCEHYATKRKIYDKTSYFGEFDVGNNWNVVAWKYIEHFEEVEV